MDVDPGRGSDKENTMQTKSATLTHWAHLTASMAANADSLPHLEAHRQLLESLLSEAQSLCATQSAHTAASRS